MYTDMRDFEPEFTTTTDDGLLVEISKVGGGTLGEVYDGNWSYRVTDGQLELEAGHGFFTGTPKTHAEVAAILLEIIDQGDES